MKQKNRILFYLLLFVVGLGCVRPSAAQTAPGITLTAANLADSAPVSINKTEWAYHPGDDPAWREPAFADADWEKVTSTSFTLQKPPQGGWNGRGWFRLRFKVDENVAERTFAITGQQFGASEIYLDGQLLTRFGEIYEPTGETEYNPAQLPIPFKFKGGGEHLLAVRYSFHTFNNLSALTQAWLRQNNVRVGFAYSLADATDLRKTIENYSEQTSMRTGFLFVGILSALALLHFLLFIFYRVERGNLFYSLYVAAFAINVVCGNILAFGHLGLRGTIAFGLLTNFLIGIVFTQLTAFLHVAFGRRLDWKFWCLAVLWALICLLGVFFINNLGKLWILPSLTITISFTFVIYLLIDAARKKHPGAWILITGVQLFAISMFVVLLRQLKVLTLTGPLGELSEVVLLLGVPIAVSVFLARGFARTNRSLVAQLENVKLLSEQKVEQERRSAILAAENERRSQELEEARQLQLSMLPGKLPQFPALEIAAYMKPATEVGGDYYDFHIGKDGGLTVVIGDATGHGLKAGSVVTATKSLFNAFAEQESIPQIFSQTSLALKKMNLRGLFMAMAMLKIKDGQMSVCIAGMPAALIYRAASRTVEEISIRALPLGSVAKFKYKQQETELSSGDCVLVMSDGWPEMFNEQDEMIGFAKAAEILPDIVGQPAQHIINHLVNLGQEWSGRRLPDDDVTFIVLKVL